MYFVSVPDECDSGQVDSTGDTQVRQAKWREWHTSCICQVPPPLQLKSIY